MMNRQEVWAMKERTGFFLEKDLGNPGFQVTVNVFLIMFCDNIYHKILSLRVNKSKRCHDLGTMTETQGQF